MGWWRVIFIVSQTENREVAHVIHYPIPCNHDILLTCQKTSEATWNEDAIFQPYPKIKILTIEGLLSGKERVEAPPQLNPFAKAQREGKGEKQGELI